MAAINNSYEKIAENVEKILLEFLSESEDYGYNMKKRIKKTHGVLLRNPFIYEKLREMEGEGLVASRNVSKGSRQLVFYKITEMGQEELKGKY